MQCFIYLMEIDSRFLHRAILSENGGASVSRNTQNPKALWSDSRHL